MKTFNLKYILTTITMMIVVGLQAQQTIDFGDVKIYTVDAADGPNGTPESTYTWSVFTDATPPVDITSSLSITHQTTTGNSVQIDWGTTPAGTYTLKVVETNNGCIGEEKEITVIISAVVNPTLKAENASICITDPTEFTIANAPAGSKISYTVNGGTTTDANLITVDASGNATITVTPTVSETQIVVTLTSMELANGTIIDLTADNITATTVITTTTTTDIDFD